jgi:hypothetical protein
MKREIGTRIDSFISIVLAHRRIGAVSQPRLEVVDHSAPVELEARDSERAKEDHWHGEFSLDSLCSMQPFAVKEYKAIIGRRRFQLNVRTRLDYEGRGRMTNRSAFQAVCLRRS